MSLNLAHYLELTAKEKPDKTAVILDEFRLTYQELDAFAKRVANVLVEKGVRKGEKVALMIPNIPHFPMIYYGILYAGATVVPVNCLLRGQEIEYYLEDSEAKVFFVWKDYYKDGLEAFNNSESCRHLVTVSVPGDDEKPTEGEAFMPLIMNAEPEFDMVETMPDDTAVILYTSGTTGHPKGAELTHFNMFFNAYMSGEKVIKIEKDDVGLAVLPLFHSFGQTCVMNVMVLTGGTVTMAPKWDTEHVLEVIARDKVTVIAMVPTMYFHLLHYEGDKKVDLSSIRMATSGGAALPVEVLKAFEKKFNVRILEGYGLSETSPVASFNVIERPSKPGSIGVPIWGCEMRIMREDGTFADVDEVGEIVIRGHNVMKGYYDKPVATSEAIVDGWFHTGDLATKDDEGYFFIVDRKKDMIIRSGMNIYPREIEEVLYAHPAVTEACVIGVPDEIRGEVVKAFVALRKGDDLKTEELDKYCQTRLAKYKCPKQFEILDSLPKGPTGKILKKELREAELGRLSGKAV